MTYDDTVAAGTRVEVEARRIGIKSVEQNDRRQLHFSTFVRQQGTRKLHLTLSFPFGSSSSVGRTR
jgi:hypothetical protein